MQVRWKGAVLSAVVAGGLVGFAVIPQQANASPQAIKFGDLTKTQKRLISGLASTEVDQARGALAKKAPAQPQKYTGKAGGAGGNFYFPSGSRGCSYTLGSNVNMDTDCQNVSDPDLAGRGQAQNETYISEDHSRPGNLLGSSNDYRRGDGGCFGYYSLDNARTFQDVAMPFSFTRGGALYGGAARQYWGGGGDTSSAFDTRGNAYYSCQVFNRGLPTSSNPDLSSALIVFRSTGNAGASYTFPARVVAQEPDIAGTGTAPFLDKQLMTVDNHVGSRFRDRVYVTWTTFAPDGSAYIYESHSADYAETWSAPVRVSAANPTLCKVNSDKAGDPDQGGGGDGGDAADAPAPGQCYANQDSQPFTGPDGALYVTWANYNNAAATGDNRNQILIAKSTDGGSTFSTPVKATDYYDLPDCVTYTGQDPGRACVPTKRDNTSFFRATNYPVGAVDPKDPKHVVVTVGSYINAYSNEANGCTPTGFASSGNNTYTGVRTVGACNNGIIVSDSRNGGATFTGQTTDPRKMPLVTQAKGQRTTDQWFQWADYTKDGRLAVSYYDRQYGNAELTGFSDFSLSGSRDIVHFGQVRVTSSSMPPPTQFSGQFWGDYTGLAAWTGTAHPAWSDTRTPEVFTCAGSATVTTPPALCTSGSGALRANDQEAMTDSIRVPSPK